MSNDTTTPELRVRFYQGSVNDVLSFMMFVGHSCVLLTMIAAARFFKPEEYKLHSPLTKLTVTILCFLELFHGILTTVLKYTTSKDLSFSDSIRVPWSMKATFLLTTLVTFVSQCYFLSVLYQASDRKKWIVVFQSVWIIGALVQGIGSTFFGQTIRQDHGVGSYVSLVIITAGTSQIADYGTALGISHYMIKRQARWPSDLSRTNIFLLTSWLIAVFVIAIPRFVTFVAERASNNLFWSIARLSGFELLGNLYPYVLITLMTMPGFANWEENDVLVSRRYTNI